MGTDSTVLELDLDMAKLIRNPITMKKLQREVKKATQGNEDISQGDLDKMPYLKFVIKERFRLHMPVPFTCSMRIDSRRPSDGFPHCTWHSGSDEFMGHQERLHCGKVHISFT